MNQCIYNKKNVFKNRYYVCTSLAVYLETKFQLLYGPVLLYFVMYYIYGQSGPSLLIESTESMITVSALDRPLGVK